MTDELTASKTITWSQEYKGVRIKLKFWGKSETHTESDINEGHGMWCYYLTVVESQCPDYFEELFWTGKNDYYTDTSDAMDLHGGCTFYEPHETQEKVGRAGEFGCDYGHLWDRESGYNYTKDTVWFDAKASVDALLSYLEAQGKSFLVRCKWNGKYYEADQIDERGYGPDGQAKSA